MKLNKVVNSTAIRGHLARFAGRFLLASTMVSGLAITYTAQAGHHEKGEKASHKGDKSLKKVKSQILSKLKSAKPGINIESIESTTVPGIYKVELSDRGGIIYSTATGDQFFLGDLYTVKKDDFVNVTEQEKNIPRAKLMSSIKKEDMIVFSPKGKVKASISVFTDVDCGYCRKLHQEVPALNEMGIEVRYLAYPRAGVGSGSYKKIASAWCAKDPNEALTRLKQNQNIEEKVCDENPVQNQLQVGNQAGVTGTPAIVLENGELVPGYMPADRLAARIGI